MTKAENVLTVPQNMMDIVEAVLLVTLRYITYLQTYRKLAM